MEHSKNKWTCPHCDHNDKQEVVGVKETDSSLAVYKCSSCQGLFTIASGCGSYTSEIPYRGQIKKEVG